MIQAVTFDFWNTLMWEEPGSLRENRLDIWAQAIRSLGATIDPAQAEAVHDAVHQRYVESWTAGRQFRVEEAVLMMLDLLDGQVPRDIGPALTAGFSEAGMRAAIHPADGVLDCLSALKEAGVRLGIICDIGLTPSPALHALLHREDLFDFFDAMSFSDETGMYKPDRAIFMHALEALGGVEPQDAAHVGDRLRTDVGGAIAVGMTAVRYNRVYDDPAPALQEAHIVTDDLSQLPALLGVAEVRR